MNTIKSVSRPASLTIAAVVLLSLFNRDTHGWSVTGTVKSSSGATPLSGVSVTVEDSSNYSTTTDANGNFKFESKVATLNQHSTSFSNSYSAQISGNKLMVRSPVDGAMKLSLIDCSGRTVWSTDATANQGVAKVAFPRDLFRRGVLFLLIRQGDVVEYRSLGSGVDGSFQMVSPVTTARVAAAYPKLLFKKTDYNDTSFSMTSENMTNVAIVMTSASKTCPLPTTLNWQSSGIVVNIHPDGSHNIVSVKDPTIQKYKGKYLIYCTVYNKSNSTFSMQFIQFEDFAKANDATPYFMDQTSGFSGYKCAPELFYFEPQDTWYLIWQQQEPAYSTTKTPDDPKSWSTPKKFASNWDSWKAVVKGQYGAIDYWPIADDKNFYIFCTGDDGSVYRSKTTLAQFPNGFSALEIVKRFNGTDVIFEGGSHYKVKGTTNTYLHLVEGQGSGGRYFSAWTSEGLEGEWKDYKVGQNNPFARYNKVSYPAGTEDWTDDVSHGELLRDNPNQIQEVDPCNFILLYQGMKPGSGGDYNSLPYRLGLLTAK